MADPETQNENAMECGVCLMADGEKVLMPCCGREESTTCFCRLCLQLICQHSPDSIGRCPQCRKYFKFLTDGSVETCDRTGRCQLCCQNKILVTENLCENCLLGTRYTFTYECNTCHRSQQIPHPMWTYQPTAQEFGSTSWACHQGCGTYTNWRIQENCLNQIPAQEIPESWGGRETWLESIREARHNGANTTNNTNNDDAGGDCILS